MHMWNVMKFNGWTEKSWTLYGQQELFQGLPYTAVLWGLAKFDRATPPFSREWQKPWTVHCIRSNTKDGRFFVISSRTGVVQPAQCPICTSELTSVVSAARTGQSLPRKYYGATKFERWITPFPSQRQTPHNLRHMKSKMEEDVLFMIWSPLRVVQAAQWPIKTSEPVCMVSTARTGPKLFIFCSLTFKDSIVKPPNEKEEFHLSHVKGRNPGTIHHIRWKMEDDSIFMVWSSSRVVQASTHGTDSNNSSKAFHNLSPNFQRKHCEAPKF